MDNRSLDVPTLAGVVKDGVIVPDRPLSEGTYVEITVPNAPREIVDRVRWDRTDKAKATRSIEGVSVTVGNQVDDLLRHHAAEAVFSGLVRWIQTCFPGLSRSEVGLIEDVHAPGLIRVSCAVTLPPDLSVEQQAEAERRFFHGYGTVVPDKLATLFTFDFIAPERR